MWAPKNTQLLFVSEEIEYNSSLQWGLGRLHTTAVQSWQAA